MVELRADGLHLRRKRARRNYHLSFDQLWHQANGQGEFSFNAPKAKRHGKARRAAGRPGKKAAPAGVLATPGPAVPQTTP